MLLETRSRNLIITDIRDAAIFRRYITANAGTITKPVKSLWKKQRETITTAVAERIIQANGVPSDLLDTWRNMIIEFVERDLTTEWMRGIITAGNGIARKVNRIQTKQFDFNDTMQSVKAWIDKQGGSLIVNLTAAQYGSAQALIQHQITWGVTSPYLMAQRIKPIIGLTQREALAVTRLMTSMAEENIPANVMNLQVERYAKTLHNNRAMRIARTEISDSYNFGQWDSVKQARDEGRLPGEPEKEWIAGGGNPCDICLDNEGEGPIPINQAFSSGDDTPTAHPQCQCSQGFSVRR